MATSEIRVERSGGGPVSGARVVLSFFGGQTDAARTGSDGVAEVDHEGSGKATIYVDGKECGFFTAPGRWTVHL